MCQRLVDRSIRCLELEVQAGETNGFSTTERLERERIHRRNATKTCRTKLAKDQNLAQDLAACLALRNCMAYSRCKETATLRARARRALSKASNGQPNDDDSLHQDLSSVCGDRYLMETLASQADMKTKHLLANLRSACRSLERRRITDIKANIDKALAPSNEHPISDLSQVCSQVAQGRPEKGQQNASGRKQPQSPERRAVERLCHEQWRLRSALNNMRRIRGFLQPPGCAECALRVCRFLTVTKVLKQSPLPAVQSLVRRFERLCRVTTPVFWIQNRLTRRRRPGPMTCRRADSLLQRALAQAPDDPTVQVAACLLDQRCRSRRSNH